MRSGCFLKRYSTLKQQFVGSCILISYLSRWFSFFKKMFVHLLAALLAQKCSSDGQYSRLQGQYFKLHNQYFSSIGRILVLSLRYCPWSQSTAYGAKVLAMELEVLALEPKILASELWILDFGAQNTGHWSPEYWPPEPHFLAGNAAGRCRNSFEKNEKHRLK